MTQQNAFFVTHVPTRRERLWRALGYRFHLGEEPKDIEAKTGWFKTETWLHLSVADRLRILFSGHLKVLTTCYSDGQPENIKSRFDYVIADPFTKFPRS